MKLDRQRTGTVEILSPQGALVDEDAEQFAKALVDTLRGHNPRVVVAMEEVPYLDSVALEGLLEATELLADRSDRLKLAEVPATCREILEMTGLAGKFRFFNSTQDAVRSFL